MKTVLIVDDERLFLSSLADVLPSYFEDLKVLTAEDGSEAIITLHTEDVDLVVTDLKMPLMDGFQLLVYMLNKQINIPVVVMTAFGTPDIEQQVSAFGAVGWIEKPIDTQVLADTIKECFLRQEGLNRRVRGNLKGITLATFLKILETESKTCTLRVISEGRVGTIYFKAGELVNAEHELRRGEQALFEILNWHPEEITLENVCKKKDRVITRTLTQLLRDLSNDEPPAPENLETAVPPTPEIPPQPAIEDTHDNGAQSYPWVNDLLDGLRSIDGLRGLGLANWKQGTSLGVRNITHQCDQAELCQEYSKTVKIVIQSMRDLEPEGTVEDMLFTTEDEFQLIRIVPTHPELFILVTIDKQRGNLAMARYELTGLLHKLGV